MKKRRMFLLFIILSCCSFAAFWLGRTTSIGSGFFKISNNSMKPLRMSGYQYISPLLACDTQIEMSSPKMNSLSNKIHQYIKTQTSQNRLTIASVYIRDYQNGYIVDINPSEEYYPASLGKIPMMIAAYKVASSEPEFLDRSHQYSNGIDLNQNVEIKPRDYLKPGNSYTINDAINKMIISSDNNSLFFLNNYIDGDTVDQTFKDLKIPLSQDSLSDKDFLTAKEYSYFIRVLYNSTYLNEDYSEKALKLLDQSEFKNGLVAGLPHNTKIAHKFGIITYQSNGKTKRELHDCGIVYKDKPYLICVMTKNSSSLQDSENVIRDISAMTYDSLRK